MSCIEPTLTTPLLSRFPNQIDYSDQDSQPITRPETWPEPNKLLISIPPSPNTQTRYKCLATIEDNAGPISSLTLCGEFLFSASSTKDITVWQHPDLCQFAKFGHGEGSVKALVAVGNRVFSAHQDGKVRVWKVSTRSENVFRLVASLPTTRDYLGRCLKQSNYVQTRRNHRRLWIEHGDSISCLAVHRDVVYSGSWDRTLKVWRMSDLRCLESIRAHDDAINAIAVHDGIVYTASADGKIKAWGKINEMKNSHCLMNTLVARNNMSWNAVATCVGTGIVYAAGSDGHVAAWQSQLEKEKKVWRLVCDVKAHDMAVLSLCVVSELVFSGSGDRSIGVWKRKNGGELVKLGFLRGHEGPVRCLQASWYRTGRGYVVYSGGLDRSLRVWWVPQEENIGEK
ncbi:protein JINGUBANG-like [Carex rostrata]